MTIRAIIGRHPHRYAMITFVVALFSWGVLMPEIWHQPPDWTEAIVLSVVLVMVSYSVRFYAGIRSRRVQALLLAGLSLVALTVYATAVRAHGVPQQTTERFYFAFVVAIPIVAIVWSLRMLRRFRASA
ncbi:MAG TPA: hypothetical protein VN602_05285 [Gemmatimonadaceae bacterium]|nr:hypothetical protein [Gemmatimonadaceae bacterium]